MLPCTPSACCEQARLGHSPAQSLARARACVVICEGPPPQVQLYLVLQKFDNKLEVDNVKLGRRRFLLTRLPRYV